MGQLEPRPREGRWKAGQPVSLASKTAWGSHHQERSPRPPTLLLLSEQGIPQAFSCRRCENRHAAAHRGAARRPPAPSVLGGRGEGPAEPDRTGAALRRDRAGRVEAALRPLPSLEGQPSCPPVRRGARSHREGGSDLHRPGCASPIWMW